MRYLYTLLICYCCITISQSQIIADFGADVEEVCAPATIQFSDSSSSTLGAITQWNWTRDGITFSNLQHPALFFPNPGVYDVCLTVTDNLGNSQTHCKTNYIKAYQSPTAYFYSNRNSGCLPVNISFTDTSQLGDAPIRQWRWDFGDGNIDTINQNPTHTYLSPGTFDVTLVVIDTNGCSHSLLLSNYITIYPTLTANIVHNATQPQCGIPSTVNFIGLSNGNTPTYVWDFDDGFVDIGQTTSHTYQSGGCVSPVLYVSTGDGCMATATIPSCINIVPKPTASFTLLDSTACYVPFSPTISNNSSGANSYFWDFGDSTFSYSQNISHTYLDYDTEDTANYTNGVFPISLVATNSDGCKDTMTQLVYISNMQAQLNAPNTICAPDTVSFSTNVVYASQAFYTTSFQWILDNGNPSIFNTATAVYPDSGLYNVSVIVTDNIGCMDTLEKVMEVGIVPTIDSFVALPPIACRRDGISLDAYGSSFIDTWLWNFSDGTGSFGPNINHVFQDTGYVTGDLVAMFRGCIATVNLDSYYVLPPIANFEPLVDCDTLLVYFADSSIGADTWFWDFGDTTTLADTSHLQNPSYTYPGFGSYDVRLVVYNAITGCTDEYWKTIKFDAPLANFEVGDSFCAPALVRPISLSEGGLFIGWFAPQGSIDASVIDTPSILFPNPGIHTIRLVNVGANQCQDTISKIIHVAGLIPDIQHNPDPTCRPAYITYVDSSVGVLSPLIDWQWSTGSTTNTTTGVYAFPGSPTVDLQVTNDWGCVFDLSKTVKVGGLLLTFAATQNVCIGNNITATALIGSPLNSGAFPPYTFIWDFGDGAIDTTFGIVSYHKYAQAGVYDVCLTVIDSIGCTTSLCRTDWVEVHDPASLFTADTFYSSCPPLEVNFSNLSLSGSSWSWDFGDGSTSILENPTHVYSTPGFYDVILAVSAFSGCAGIDTIRQMIKIEGPEGDFQPPAMTACAPVDISIIATGTNIAKYTWLYGDGGSDIHINNTNTDTTQYTYQFAGSYVPILFLEDSMGCQVPIERDTIHVLLPPVPLFDSDTLVCQGDSISYQLQNTIGATTRVEWFFEGGLPASDTLFNPTVFYPNTGTFDVTLVLWENGCSDTLIRTDYIQIKSLPQAIFGIIQPDSCIPILVQFEDSSTTLDGFIQDWSWDFGNGQIATSQDSSLSYFTADTFAIQLIVNNNYGCTDTIQKQLRTYPLPTADAGIYPTICEGDTLQLQGIGIGEYQWQTTAWLSNDTLANPLTTPDSTTSYQLTITNEWGCQASDTTVIAVSSLVTMQAGDSVAICLGDSIQLQGGANQGGFVWQTDSTLSCQSCQNPIASPTETTIYYLNTAINTVCTTGDSVVVVVYPKPIAQIIADSFICEGDTLQLQGIGVGEYQWQTTATAWLSNDTIENPLTTADSTATYQLTITNEWGCQVGDTTVIAVLSLITMQAGDSIAICLGDSIQLQGSANQGGFVWQTDSTLSCQSCQNPIASPTETTIYYLNTAINTVCTTGDSVLVLVHPNPIAQIMADSSICEGDTVQLQAFGGQSYHWLRGADLSDSLIANPVATPLIASVYQVAVVDSNGCRDTSRIFINVRSNDFLALPNQTICLGDSIAIGSPLGTSHSWSGMRLSCQSCLNPIASPLDSTLYTVAYYNQNNCPIKDSLWVNVIDLTQLQALVSDTICLGDSIQLGVVGHQGLAVFWQPNYNITNSMVATPWVYPHVDTQYRVEINQGACIRTDSIQITIKNNTHINAIGGSYCLGDTIQLVATGNANSYQWIPSFGLNNDTIANPLVFAQQSQQYQVIGYASCGVDTAYANVVVNSPPSLVVDSSLTAALGSTVTLSAFSNSNSYTWSPADSLSCINCPNPDYLVTGNQLFWVTVQDSLGCMAIDSVWVLVNEECTTDLIFVPNAFTPNGDGHNDILWVRSGAVQEIETFEIYDRWGKLLFQTNDIQKGWDGKYQGQLLPPDVYGYFVIFRCPSTGEKLLKKANVTILR